MAEPKIRYDIEANVKGDADVGALASRLEDLAQTLDGDLKTNALGAASALRQLGEKQGAIEQFIQLKTGAGDAAQKLNDAQAAAQKYAREISATEAPTRAQTGQMNKLRDAVRTAKTEVVAQGVALSQARTALQQYSITTTNLSQSQAAVKAAVGAAKIEINALTPAYARAGQAALQSAGFQKRATAEVAQGLGDVRGQLQRIQQLATIAIGGGFLSGLAKDALATADSYNNLRARIKLVTGEGPLLESAFAGVSALALRTNSDLEQTATLFGRIAEAGKSAGLSTQAAVSQSLALTETINEAIQLSGGSADSAKAAITQLIQGLQSGVLRGEEFNSVMEQSPRLAKALADGLGRTTGELRKLAEAGSLTTDVVIRSLRSQADAIKSEFASLPPTVGRAVENLRTSWMLYLGELDKGKGITRDVAKVIDGLASNLDTILKVLGHAAVAWGGYTLSQKLAAAGARQSEIAVQRAAVAAAEQGAASGRAAVTTAAHGKAAAAAATQVSAYAAANATAARSASAVGAGAGGMAGGFRAASGAILATAGSLALYATVAYEGISILKSVGTALGEGIAKWRGYADAEAVLAAEEKRTAAAMAATAEASFKQAEALRQAQNESFGLGKAAGNLVSKFDALIKAGDSAAEAIGKIGKDFDLGTLPGIRDAASVLDKLLADGKLTAAGFKAAWSNALDGKDLAVFETTARAAFNGSKREAELLAQLIDAQLREAVKRAGVDFESLRGGVSKTAQSAVNDTQAIINSLGRLKEQGVDTSRALVASLAKGLDTADSQQALELVKAQIVSLRTTLGAKITDGLLDQAKQKSIELRDALDSALPGIQSVREAMRQLGVTTDETFKDTAARSKAAYETIRTSGKASAREVSEAFLKSATDAIAANKGIAPVWVQAQAAARGYKVEVDEAGKATLRAAADGNRAIESTAASFQQTAEQVQALTDAYDRLLMKYQQTSSYTERQIALLERENALVERRAELERKRLGVDKEGFSTDSDGKRVSMGSDVGTLTGIAAFLKAAGIDDDATSRKIAREFADKDGNVQYVNNPGQIKYGGQGSTISQALLKAAERYTFGIGTNAQGSTPASIPNQTRTINLQIDGRDLGAVNTDAAGEQVLENLIQQLADSKRASGR